MLSVNQLKNNSQFGNLGHQLEKLDKDGDGNVSTEEVVKYLLAHASNVKKRKRLQMAFFVLVIIGAILLLANFGFTIYAVILSREMTTSGNILVSPDTKSLLYAGECEEVEDFSFDKSAEDYLYLKYLTLPDSDRYRVSAVNVSSSLNLVFFKTANGDTLKLDLNSKELTSESEGLLASEGVSLTTSELVTTRAAIPFPF